MKVSALVIAAMQLQWLLYLAREVQRCCVQLLCVVDFLLPYLARCFCVLLLYWINVALSNLDFKLRQCAT